MARKIFKARRRTLIISTVLIFAGLLGGGFFATRDAFAGGTSGSGSDPTGGSCARAGATTWYDTCYGVTWRHYPVTSDQHVSTGSSNVPTVYITGCKSLGATEYYLLALEQYTVATRVGTGVQKGGMNVGRISGHGGSVPFNVTNGSDSWETAEGNWNIAKTRHGITFPTEWSATSWFCWNPEWACDPEVEECDPPDDEEETCDPETDDCDCTVDPIYGTGDFWADSEVTATNEFGTKSAAVSSKSGSTTTVTIKLSTDGTVTGSFNHKMSFDSQLSSATDATYTSQAREGHEITDSDTFPDVQTSVAISGDQGTTKTVSAKSDTSGASIHSGTFSLTPAPGETLSFCQILTHTNQTYTIKGQDNDHWEAAESEEGEGSEGGEGDDEEDGECEHDDWTFSIQSQVGVGITVICVEAYHPEEPSGGGPWSYSSAGTPSTQRMYVGQQSQVGWNTEVSWTAPRRVTGWEAVAFVTPAAINKPYSNSRITGDQNNRTDTAVCDYYNTTTKLGTLSWCGVIDTSSQQGTFYSEDGWHEYSSSQDIAVPDYVGYKYCSSFGYHWKAYYSISYNNADSWQEESGAGSVYWTYYDAACRPIMKKPMVDYWNGGVQTTGKINTSSSIRRETGIADKLTWSAAGTSKLYGSWTEYLGVVGGDNGSFGSGASLSRGSTNTAIAPSTGNVNLTIANTSATLGHSGLTPSTTLRQRLATYLESRHNVDALPSGEIGPSTTKIYVHDGDLTISNDIKLRTASTYTDIYRIPQVVIFVHGGNVYIDPSVQQIDAWIIVDNDGDDSKGKIDTCSSWTSHSTETKANGYTYNEATLQHCDKQLTFNGPVFASSVILNRTYGADPIVYDASTNLYGDASQRYTPAEIFNLSAEAYLWSYAQAGRYASSYTSGYTRELPPRY